MSMMPGTQKVLKKYEMLPPPSAALMFLHRNVILPHFYRVWTPNKEKSNLKINKTQIGKKKKKFSSKMLPFKYLVINYIIFSLNTYNVFIIKYESKYIYMLSKYFRNLGIISWKETFFLPLTLFKCCIYSF